MSRRPPTSSLFPYTTLFRSSSALRAVRNALATQPDVYIVNEGANTLDFGRNIIDMDKPRHRLDSGTWGVRGRSEEHTSELQSQSHLVCRLLLEKKKE